LLTRTESLDSDSNVNTEELKETLLEAKLRKGQTPIFVNRDFESLDSDSNVNTEELSETNQLTTEENNHQTNNRDNSRKCVIQ